MLEYIHFLTCLPNCVYLIGAILIIRCMLSHFNNKSKTYIYLFVYWSYFYFTLLLYFIASIDSKKIYYMNATYNSCSFLNLQLKVERGKFKLWIDKFRLYTQAVLCILKCEGLPLGGSRNLLHLKGKSITESRWISGGIFDSSHYRYVCSQTC